MYINISTMSTVSNFQNCSFYLDIKNVLSSSGGGGGSSSSSSKGGGLRRLIMEGSSFADISTLRQIIFARVTKAKTSSLRKRMRTKTDDDTLKCTSDIAKRSETMGCIDIDDWPLHKTA